MPERLDPPPSAAPPQRDQITAATCTSKRAVYYSLIFGRDLESSAALIARRDSIIEMIVRFVRR